jgi:cobalt-zinc-cadmium efflux system outer membrane protein
MKAIDLLVSAVLCASAAEGASRQKPAPVSVEKVVHERTGQQVQWQREQSAREEAQQAVRAILRHPLTATRAAQVALLNNRSLQATFEEIGLARAEVIEAGLLKNPTFEGSARFPDRPPSAANLEGSIAQEFLDLLLLPLRKRVAQAQLRQAQLRVADEVLKLVAETKVAFYEAQAAQQLAGRLKLIQEAAAAAIEIAQQQHAAGNVSELALANQQAGYSQSRLELAGAEAEVREKRERLNRLMGLWGRDTDWKLGDELPPVPAGEIPTAGLETLAIEQRLDLAAAKAEVASVVQALGLTKTYRFLGALELGVSSERDSDRQTVTGPTLKLELPIFNRGQGRIARWEAQLRQAERRLEALAIDIRSEVREKRDRLTAKRDSALFYRDQLVPERTRILNLTLLHYNAMFLGVYDLLRARQEELTAERGYTEALRDYWSTRAELERALGGSLVRRKTAPLADAKETKAPARTSRAGQHQH